MTGGLVIPFLLFDSVAADGAAGLAAHVAGEEGQVPVAADHPLHVVGAHGIEGGNGIAEHVPNGIGKATSHGLCQTET